MTETKNQSTQRDYTERFEFRFTMKNKEDGSETIICQRYFKIIGFNLASLRSYELVDCIRGCADRINRDLKSKTQVYLEMFAPRYFSSEEEMEKYFENPNHKATMRLGEGLVLTDGSGSCFYWDGEKPVKCENKFDDGELYAPVTEDDVIEYKLAFCDGGREVCSTVFTGVYPRYIRNSIDLSNRRGRFDGDDITRLSFEQYLLYNISKGRQDLIYWIIREICDTCTYHGNNQYMVSDEYKDENGNTVVYKNRAVL